MSPSNNEQTPLLQERWGGEGADRTLLRIEDLPKEYNPREWTRWNKMANVVVIACMSILSPLVSSMFTPGIAQIAEDLNTSTTAVIGTTTGYVVMLGIGPLVLAPLSETFGRRNIYLTCFSVFALLQIPTGFSPNIGFLIAIRSVAGFFGSVGVANGGGTISGMVLEGGFGCAAEADRKTDMFIPSERAGVFGWYLLGPLLGPTIGPLLGGVIVQELGWRWTYWIMAIVSIVNTAAGYFLLRETYVPRILSQKKDELERDASNSDMAKYSYEGEDTRPLRQKLLHSLKRPPKIFAQPIVATMAVYQALIFGTTFSIYTNMQKIYSELYGFDTEHVGLLYLGPGLGFLFAVFFLVPRIDTVYKSLTAKHGEKAKPEYRLPLANIGAVLIPISLFWFAWTVEKHAHWFASISGTFFYGIGQVMILNCTQNYYIDSFEKYAASAIAAGTVFRSLVGGIVPLAAPGLFEKLGYGWGISVFAFIGLLLAPAPILFYVFGERLRERFPINL